METYLAYFDETGDDGLIKYSSDHFVLTSLYMPSSKWQENYDALRLMRRGLRDDFGLHVTEEFHTKQFLTDKNPYRAYSWTSEQKQEILKRYTITLASLDMQCMNVVIDKTKVKSNTCNSVQREHDKKLNNGLPILHMIPPYRDYGRYFCIQAGKGGTIRPGLIKYQAHFLYPKQEVLCTWQMIRT